jgi:hyperosmotically inducible protein
VPGVQQIDNRILLSVPNREDRAIRDEVEAYLFRNPAFENYRGPVEVENGFVILSGFVISEFRRELAESVAKGVSGVRGVENKLRVDHLAARSDQEIAVEVKSKIKWDPLLQDPQISVEVRDGRVTLTGVIENPRLREQAINDARVAGVQAVEAAQLKVL